MAENVKTNETLEKGVKTAKDGKDKKTSTTPKPAKPVPAKKKRSRKSTSAKSAGKASLSGKKKPTKKKSKTTPRTSKKPELTPKDLLLQHVSPKLVYMAENFVEVQTELPDFEPMELGALGRKSREYFDDDLIAEAVDAAKDYPDSARLFEIARYIQHKNKRNLAKVLFMSGVFAKQSAAKCWDHLAQMLFDENKPASAVAIYDYMLAHEQTNFFQNWQAALANAALGRASETVKLISACEKRAKNKIEKERLLPLLAFKAYASNKPVVLSRLIKENKGTVLKIIPDWLKRKIQSAARKLVPHVTNIPANRLAKMLDDFQTALETRFDSPKYWEEMSTNFPDSVELVTKYLDQCLGAGGKGVKSELLSVYQKPKKLEIETLEVAIGSYLKLNFVDDAHFVLMKQKLPSTEITGFFERLIARLGDSEAMLELVDRTRAQYPDNSDFAILNGTLAARLGQQKRAEECLWLVFDHHAELLDYPERLQLAIALQMSNKPQQALEVLDNIAKDSLEWETASAMKSRIAYQTGRFDPAILAAHERLSADFENRDDLKDLCFAYRAAGHHRDAFFTAQELLAGAGGNEDEYMQALGLMVTEAALSQDRELMRAAHEAVKSDTRIHFSGWTRTWIFISFYLILGDKKSAHYLADNFYRKNQSNQIAILTAEWLRNYAGDRSGSDLSAKIIDQHERDAMTALRQNPELDFSDKSVWDFDLNALIGGPRVTVVVPCYNEARFLADCLNSVWMQCYPFWECIIVDDVSNDMSTEVAKNYARADKRFKYVRHAKNLGLAGSRNTGLKHARAPYVTFLDSDDYLTVDSILFRYRQLAGTSKQNIVGSYCMIKHVAEHDLGVPIKASAPEPSNFIKSYVSSGFEAPFNAHAPILKTDILRNMGGFTQSMRMGAEDWDCWGRMMRAGYSFIPTRRLGGFYRQKRGSMVRSLSKFHVAEAIKMYRRVSEYDENPGDGAFFRFTYPVWVYQGVEKFYFRALRFAAMAHMAGDLDGFSDIIAKLPGSLAMVQALNIDIRVFVTQGVNRFLSTTDEELAGANRRLYKKQAIAEITAKIESYLDGRDPETKMEDFFPVLTAKTEPSKKRRAKKSVNAEKIATIGVPAYVRLEEKNAHLADEERLRALHNIHAGERCFVVGNGPSLNKMDLTLLNKEKSFAVNGIFYKTREVGYKPSFYMVEDTSVMKENIKDIIAYDVEKKFFPTVYAHLHPHDENTYFFNMNRGFYERKSPNYCVPRFSTDFALRSYCGQSVTMLNLQLAYYMGFHEVYLVGMDFSYVIPKNFERKGDIITSTDDDPNHFHPDYFGKGKTWKDPKLDRVLANYAMAKLAYETSGRKIYNATVGGRLELFERVDFNSLFKGK